MHPMSGIARHAMKTPFSLGDIQRLRAGDLVFITGDILGARDIAHKRMFDLLEKGEELPVDLDGQVIYYVGPSPARPGRAVGAAGPTTGGRMDSYTPRLLKKGVRATIGKGRRSLEVVEDMRTNGSVYLGAIGGAGALLSKAIVGMEVIAWEELGPEALMRLTVKDFPTVVVNDLHGGDLYKLARSRFGR